MKKEDKVKRFFFKLEITKRNKKTFVTYYQFCKNIYIFLKQIFFEFYSNRIPRKCIILSYSKQNFKLNIVYSFYYQYIELI